MLVNDYRVNGRSSLDRAQRSVAHLRTAFGRSRASSSTSDRVDAYIVARQKAGAKSATIRLELAALKRMFTLGVRAGRVPVRPLFPSIEVRNTRQGFFEEPELKAVLAQLRSELRPVVEFAHLTGWRRGEVLSLQWRQVDLAAGVVRLEPGTTKNDEGRTFPVADLPELAELLKRQRELTSALERASGSIVPWVFHRSGQPIRNFHDAWREACKRAKVSRLFHDLRRTAVRNLERASVPRSVALKLTGHKTESIYRRYAIVSERDLAEGVAKLAAMRTVTNRHNSARAAGAERESESAEAVGSVGAGGGGRTLTGGKPNGILSCRPRVRLLGATGHNGPPRAIIRERVRAH